jgi:hypothetical protein
MLINDKMNNNFLTRLDLFIIKGVRCKSMVNWMADSYFRHRRIDYKKCIDLLIKS